MLYIRVRYRIDNINTSITSRRLLLYTNPDIMANQRDNQCYSRIPKRLYSQIGSIRHNAVYNRTPEQSEAVK